VAARYASSSLPPEAGGAEAVSDGEVVDTLIVGAGPYGLSAAAHMTRAGVAVRLVGQPMESWSQMPEGMLLRSPVPASSLSDPDRRLTFERFRAEQGLAVEAPIPLETFVDYGHWFAGAAELDVDRRLVTDLRSDGARFTAALGEGGRIHARRVVLAMGHRAFQWIPPQFRDLPGDLVSHAGDHRDLAAFAGREILIVGSGQSGIECAALAHERGATVRVLARGEGVNWLIRSARLHGSRLRPLLYSPSDVGPAGLSRIVAAPGAFRLVPSAPRWRATIRCVRPAAAAWLVSRTVDIPVESHVGIREATAESGRVRVSCNDGRAYEADHVLLATGYRVEFTHHQFISPALHAAIRTANGSPVLRSGFETSVPGLHVLGMPSAWSYGPLMRFVAGADFSARALTARLATAGAIRHEPAQTGAAQARAA
jgi:FAD-dependent urate hydroxylase